MLSWIERTFGKDKQFVLVPGCMELTVLHKTKTVLLFVSGVITDDKPYQDLARHFKSKGYYMQVFTFEPKVEK